jgi:hypothetical protein
VSAPVEVVLLRGLLAELSLRPGAVLAARVLERDGGRGLLALEGGRVWATLPEGVEPGARLRLRVVEATPERVHLQVVPDPASPPPVYSLPLPGVQLMVQEREPPSGQSVARPARTVLLRVDSPALGRLDLRVSTDAITVQAAAGEPVARARDEAGALRSALQGALGRSVPVSVEPVRFDAHA